jgi:hypothetical protein
MPYDVRIIPLPQPVIPHPRPLIFASSSRESRATIFRTCCRWVYELPAGFAHFDRSKRDYLDSIRPFFVSAGTLRSTTHWTGLYGDGEVAAKAVTLRRIWDALIPKLQADLRLPREVAIGGDNSKAGGAERGAWVAPVRMIRGVKQLRAELQILALRERELLH